MSTAGQTSGRQSPLSLKRLLFWLHIWIGLALGIPFALLGITGSILVYEQPINDFFTPAPRASAVGEIGSPQAIIDAGVKARNGAVAQSLTMPAQSGDPAIVRFTGGEAEGRRPATVQVFVDPVSLQVLETRQATRSYWMGMVHDLHGSMMLGGREGRGLVGWFGVGMLALGLTGIVLWWPRQGRWRDAYGVKKGARGWLFLRQLHGTCGITAWLLFIILSFSGIAIAFPQTTTALVRTSLGEGPGTVTPLGPGAQAVRVEPLPGTASIDADKALALATQSAPKARLTTMFLAARADQPVRVSLLPEGASAGAPTITVTIDPYRAQTIGVRDPWAGDLGDDVMSWQRPLHTGRGTNDIYRAAIFLVGLLPPLFAVTGMMMWWAKRRARAAVSRRSEAMEGVAAE